MAFRLGFNQQRFGAPPRPPFGNFRMQFRPGFRAPTPAFPNQKDSQPQELEVKADSGLLFVSNIDENCPNDLVKDMLDTFGKVEKWTRIQGPDGNFPPFGFCGYENSSSAIQAILTLNNFHVGTKRLNVKANEKTKQTLVDFVINDRIAKRLSRKALGKELEPDEGERESIKKARENLRDLLYKRDPKLVNENDDDLIMESGEVKSDETTDGKRSSKKSEKKHRSRKHSHKRSRSRSSAKKSKKRKRSTSSHSTDSTHSNAQSDREAKKSRRKSTPEDRINGLNSDDSDFVLELKERKRENRRKDEDYLRVLKKFEERERRMMKLYEKDEEDEQSRKKALLKEAKKLAQFLEDYDDERDDPKYYKGSLFSKRKHIYEMEREADKQDRQEEAKEIESITVMIRSENKDVKERSESGQNGSANSTKPVVQKQNGKTGEQPFHYSFTEEKTTSLEPTPQPEINEWSPAYAEASTSKTQSTSKVITLQNKILSQVNSVFAEDEPEEDHTHVIKKKIKPFEITAQDRIESMTAEERKQMVKELIEAIPTNKEALFAYTVAWDQLDTELIDQRIKPWVEKKIRDYLGDDEPSLVGFVCDRVTTHSEPARLLLDLAMILDSEAESFMIKLWRLIIFQTEAKKVGLNVNSANSARP